MLTGTGVGSNFLFDFVLIVSDLDVVVETRLDLYQYAISSMEAMDPCQLAWIHALFLA